MFIGQAILQYLNQSDKKNQSSKLYSACARFICPSLGHSYPSDTRRMSKKQKEDLVDFLNNTYLNTNINFLNIFDINSKSLDCSVVAPYRSTIKDFYLWCLRENIIISRENADDKNEEIVIFIRRKYNSKDYINTRVGSMDWRKNPWKLMAKNNGELIYPNDYINNNLAEEIKLYKQFRLRVKKIRDISVEAELDVLMRLLGWLHRFNGVSLESLSITSLIYEYPLYSTLSKEGSIDNLEIKNAYLRRVAYEKAAENMELIKNYFDTKGSYLYGSSKLRIIDNLINYAKFIFNKQIGYNQYFEEENDLYIIKKLRTYKKGIHIEKQRKYPYEYKMVSWNDALDVLEILRNNAKATHYKYPNYKSLVKIPLKCKSKLMQFFLANALCLLIPTDRPDAYCSLKINELDSNSLLYGYFENKKFHIQHDFNNNKSKWYIHLTKYKTYEYYGTYWSLPIPNFKFIDGSLFYDYLKEWIMNRRNYNQNCHHNYFFRSNKTMKPLKSKNFYDLIRPKFIEYKFVPVTPTCLRHMYVTHLRNINATEDEKKAAAYAMHHSVDIAETFYNEQNSEEIMSPLNQVNNKMLGSIITS